MNRSSYAKINLNHLAHNIDQFRQLLSSSTIMGVVKANAYGHGSIEIAKALSALGIHRFAVSLVQEGVELRMNGITEAGILVFTPVEENCIIQALQHKLTLTIFTVEQAITLSTIARSIELPATVHIKVDTGMGRVGGRSIQEIQSVLTALDPSWITIEGIYTHFANADNLNHPDYTHQQFKQFKDTYQHLENQGYHFPLKHCCNTSATIRFPEYHLDMVRVGIGMYGYHAEDNMRDLLPLRPVMTIISHIAHLKTVDAHVPISYGWSYYTDHRTQIATLAMGYADGIPRSLSNKGTFKVNQHTVPIIGRICMDQLMLDVSNVNEITIGDQVLWFGDPSTGAIPLDEICQLSQHYHYEILCNLSQRLPRRYFQD